MSSYFLLAKAAECWIEDRQVICAGFHFSLQQQLAQAPVLKQFPSKQQKSTFDFFIGAGSQKKSTCNPQLSWALLDVSKSKRLLHSQTMIHHPSKHFVKFKQKKAFHVIASVGDLEHCQPIFKRSGIVTAYNCILQIKENCSAYIQVRVTRHITLKSGD